jgi:hypothetical protein
MKSEDPQRVLAESKRDNKIGFGRTPRFFIYVREMPVSHFFRDVRSRHQLPGAISVSGDAPPAGDPDIGAFQVGVDRNEELKVFAVGRRRKERGFEASDAVPRRFEDFADGGADSFFDFVEESFDRLGYSVPMGIGFGHRGHPASARE